MTNEEFSNQFSTLLDSYGSIAQFGEQASRQQIVLDEFEKSTFLTQAQDIIVKSYYDRTLNPQGQGFDDSARRQVDFSSLIKVKEMEPISNTGVMFDDRSLLFRLPARVEGSGSGSGSTEYNTDVLLILNEKLLKMDSSSVKKVYVIKPISYSEYDRQMSKAYTKPLKKQAWRLFQNQSVGFDVMSEIIPRETLSSGESWKYRLRYVKRPRPIILEDLPDGLSIDGISDASSCELNPIIHMDILLKAVELAYASRSGGRTQERTQNKPERTA